MKRSDEILEVGMKAAKERLVKRPNAGEYPRDFERLYDWLEDYLFNLFEQIMLKKTKKIFEAAGEAIFVISEIAELAEDKLKDEVFKD